MSVAKAYVKQGVFSNDWERVVLRYDFDKDGGAVGVIDLMEAKGEALVLHLADVKVKTAVVSGGAATVEIGVKGGDTDAILPASLQAALTAPKSIAGDAASRALYLASGAILALEIKVAALTAGVIEVECYFSKF
jgi:hypothetical protein